MLHTLLQHVDEFRRHLVDLSAFVAAVSFRETAEADVRSTVDAVQRQILLVFVACYRCNVVDWLGVLSVLSTARVTQCLVAILASFSR